MWTPQSLLSPWNLKNLGLRFRQTLYALIKAFAIFSVDTQIGGFRLQRPQLRIDEITSGFRGHWNQRQRYNIPLSTYQQLVQKYRIKIRRDLKIVFWWHRSRLGSNQRSFTADTELQRYIKLFSLGLGDRVAKSPSKFKPKTYSTCRVPGYTVFISRFSALDATDLLSSVASTSLHVPRLSLPRSAPSGGISFFSTQMVATILDQLRV